MALKLNSIELKGFKSIDSDGQTIPINDDITVMIGANGSGKSNIVSFFQLLNNAMTDSLQVYVEKNGGADTFLHYGPKETEGFSARLHFSDGGRHNEYSFRLTYAVERLIFTEETLLFQREGYDSPFTYTFEPGNKESQLITPTSGPHENVAKVLRYLLANCRYYQFHDTTIESRIRRSCYINDYQTLKSNGGNLPAFLYGMRKSRNGEAYYNRVVSYIRQIMPLFDDFTLSPDVNDRRKITLDWREKGKDNVFGVHQFSDGTLRFIALAALLLQPPETMPSVIVIDEPELGLHPEAIYELSSMIRHASAHAQVVVSTQSPQLLDEFDERNILVVERNEARRSTSIRQLDEDSLKEWRSEYSLSELWDKNVIGGRP